MPRLKHVPSFDGAFTHDGETYPMDDGVFEVEDSDVAETIVDEYTKVSFAESDVDETPTPDAQDYPTNEDGEPLCTGKDDGQCSRTVEEPGSVCWQH